jgi:four helix bundle protein
MQPYPELLIWQRSHALALAIYQLTKRLPADERFGLTAQTRRAAASVPANIVEGSRRQHPGDFARFLNMAEGSLAELEYLLILCRDLCYFDGEDVPSHLRERAGLARMLFAFRRRIEGSS